MVVIHWTMVSLCFKANRSKIIFVL